VEHDERGEGRGPREKEIILEKGHKLARKRKESVQTARSNTAGTKFSKD